MNGMVKVKDILPLVKWNDVSLCFLLTMCAYIL